MPARGDRAVKYQHVLVDGTGGLTEGRGAQPGQLTRCKSDQSAGAAAAGLA
jgi:hypothetical protein